LDMHESTWRLQIEAYDGAIVEWQQ